MPLYNNRIKLYIFIKLRKKGYIYKEMFGIEEATGTSGQTCAEEYYQTIMILKWVSVGVEYFFGLVLLIEACLLIWRKGVWPITSYTILLGLSTVGEAIAFTPNLTPQQKVTTI